MEENELEKTIAEAVDNIMSPPNFAAARNSDIRQNSVPDPLQDRPPEQGLLDARDSFLKEIDDTTSIPVTHSKPIHGGGQLGRSKPLDQLDTAVKRLSAVEEAVAALGQRLIGSALNARKERKPFQGGATNVSARISANNDDINLYCDRILATIKAVDEILG